MSSSRPPHRRLRAFAFDPSLDTRLETAVVNQVVLQVPWETDPDTDEDLLQPGPVGEYLEVVDVDPASGAAYAPVDLDDPYVLAQDGVDPAEGDPQFHQQMVYAVAMSTIRHFEEALGRRALWSSRLYRRGGRLREEFVRRLRVYPHALREANAYYSPAKNALLFGYFPADPADPGGMLPGAMVFTCLSHDIVAHETTHALLDGMHRRFIEPSNPDVLAFHEAFADVVALFQHFTQPEVLRHQIARTRGNLERQSLLAQLAQQFGRAIGRRGALRDALGETDPETGRWRKHEPDPTALARTPEPHARGAILVAALFDAFLSIYRARIADLLRIATGGSGVLGRGELHPDLVARMADEASTSAQHMLHMCIRALDYCPPVDVTFGDYLRALITADRDMVPDDRRDYRLSLIEAFRRRGIYPEGVRSMSEDNLLWRPPPKEEQDAFARALRGIEELRSLCPEWTLVSDREAIWKQSRASQRKLHRWLTDPPLPKAVAAAGLSLAEDALPSLYRSRNGLPALEVHSVRPTLRVGEGGRTITDMVIEVTQRRRGYLDPELQRDVDDGERRPPGPDFYFRGGATLLVDLETGRVRYAIGKGIVSDRRLRAQRRFLTRQREPSLRATYFGDPTTDASGRAWEREAREPLAALHRSSPTTRDP